MDHKEKIPCTVYIMTLNAGPDFCRCLESVKDYGEILVTDGNSTDGTQDMAREYGAKVIKQSDSDEPNIPITDFAAVQNRCLQEAKFDWIFQLDMDESMTPEINEEIRQIVTQPTQYWGYYVPKKIVYKGRIIKYYNGSEGLEMKFCNRTSGAVMKRSPHHRLEFDTQKYPVSSLKNSYLAYFTIPPYNEGKNYPKRFLDMEIKEVRKQNLTQFIYWTLIIRSLKTLKKIWKIFVLYARHGFKETFPPEIEFARVQYSLLIILGSLRERIFGNYIP